MRQRSCCTSSTRLWTRPRACSTEVISGGVVVACISSQNQTALNRRKFKKVFQKINFFSAPIPAGFLPHFQTRKQRDQLFTAQRGATVLSLRGPGETALLQSLGTYPQTAAIPKEDLYTIALLVGEYKPMARERVLLQHRLGQSEKFIEAGAQVYRPRGPKDPRA